MVKSQAMNRLRPNNFDSSYNSRKGVHRALFPGVPHIVITCSHELNKSHYLQSGWATFIKFGHQVDLLERSPETVES